MSNKLKFGAWKMENRELKMRNWNIRKEGDRNMKICKTNGIGKWKAGNR